jgi:type I restriction enzyme, S subunit
VSLARVGDIAEQIRGVAYPKQAASAEHLAGAVPLLRANNISEEGLAFDNLVFVQQQYVSPRQMLRQGDIVVAASSGSLAVVGKAAQLHMPFDGTFGAFCKVIRPSERVYPGYLGHFFRTSTYRKRVA